MSYDILSPPHALQYYSHRIISRYLVDRGAAVNDGNPGGESVLDIAKRFSGPELQRYLAAKVQNSQRARKVRFARIYSIQYCERSWSFNGKKASNAVTAAAATAAAIE